MLNPILDEKQIARINAALKEVSSESDRAAAIVLSAEIDAALGDAIGASLLPTSAKEDRLLRADGPLGSFSSRIEMAFRLGLISEVLRQDLDFIRRIRNEFAHKLSGLSFTNDRVASFAHELRIASWIVENEVGGPINLDTSRQRFTISGVVILALLSALPAQVSRPTQKDPEFENPDSKTQQNIS